jgi:hypothetical protein
MPGGGTGRDEQRRDDRGDRHHELLEGKIHGARPVAILGRLRARGVEHDVQSARGLDDLVEVAVNGVLVERVQHHSGNIPTV